MSDPTRKLATIVALDVAGYSARTEADEARTIAQVTNLRPIIEGIAKAHGGRIFNTAGDGFMLEFGSAGSAVEAAIELAEECRPKVRVGVHIGDVTVQPNGDLLGHGVNVAARLMARSEPGKMTVSADVRRLIRGPLVDQFVSRGPVQLDKMAETIEIFSLAASPAAAAQGAQPGRSTMRTARATWPTPRLAAMVGVPLMLVIVAALLLTWGGGGRTTSADGGVPSASIAVLPFESLSGEKDAGYFAAGIQDEILTRLAKIGSLKVISRTSTAQFASKPENLREIARQLGVATILEGSVQKLGNAVHVNVQLIKAETDEHLWAETYDRKLDDIFGVEAEVATKIAEALSARITGSERKALDRKPTENAEAYDEYLRAIAAENAVDGTATEAHLRRAVALDPGFADAWARLANAHSFSYWSGDISNERRASALAALDKAVALDPDSPEVIMARGLIAYRINHDFAGAENLFSQVRELWPGNAEVHFLLGLSSRRLNNWTESARYLGTAVALDPKSLRNRTVQVETTFDMRDYSGAIREIDEALKLWPRDARLLTVKLYAVLSLGDIAGADRILADMDVQQFDETLPRAIAAYARLSRNYATAIARLKEMRSIGQDRLKGNVYLAENVALGLGETLALSGDVAGAAPLFEEVRRSALAALAIAPDNSSVMADLAFVHAGQGDAAAARQQIERAIEITPLASDAVDGSYLEACRVRIEARAGDRDRAIPHIKRALGMNGNFLLSQKSLALDADFDKLRGDPRFEALLK